MRIKALYLAVLSSVCFLDIYNAVQATGTNKSVPSKGLSVYEAEVLVYLVPVAHETRALGIDTKAALDTMQSNQNEYVFTLQAVEDHPNGSVLLGHFAVNKLTGEIWNKSSEQRIESMEIAGVLDILRRSHREHSSGGAAQRR